MTVVTLRPDGVSNSGNVTTGVGGSAPSITDDNSDATYVVLDSNGDYIALSMDALTLPTGAIIKGARRRARVAASTNGVWPTSAYLTGTGYTNATLVSWTTPTTVDLGPAVASGGEYSLFLWRHENTD